VLAAEHDDSELVCDSLRYVEPVQLGVQQPRQAPVELVLVLERSRLLYTENRCFGLAGLNRCDRVLYKLGVGMFSATWRRLSSGTVSRRISVLQVIISTSFRFAVSARTDGLILWTIRHSGTLLWTVCGFRLSPPTTSDTR